MERISSTANSRIKAVKRLHQKKYRDESGLYIAEGVNLLSDLPDYVCVESIFITEDKQGTIGNVPCDVASVFVVSDAVMKSISGDVTPPGVLAVIKKPDVAEDELSDAIFLDGISDSGNLGTIIRTAAGAGFKNIFAADCADCYSPKTVRASMGGVFRTNIFELSRKEASIRLAGYRKICMDMSGDNIFDFKPTGRVALLLGNEAHGLSDYVKGLADATLSLPMKNGQESLNVAVAAGIAMYVIDNSRGRSQI